MKTPNEIIPTMILARALISGLTPKRILEKINIGRVVAPGPDKKLAITRSSRDKAKDKSQLETRAGAIRGRVIIIKTLKGFAPRSKAASSNETSKSLKRAFTTS